MLNHRRLLTLLVLGVLAIAVMGQDDSCAGEDVNQPLNEQSENGGTDTATEEEPAAEEEQSPATDFEPIERSGSGSKQLEPIEVPGDATLKWTNDEDPAFRMFALMDEAFEVSVSSEAESGETFVPEGTYRFDVMGGDWSFTIEPATE